ncbi:MAG: DUF6364 family protein [Acidobacteriota bacterium]|jgi:hypothetical protein
MAKEKLNLTLDPKVIEALKLQAVIEKRSVSEIIEEIAWSYLRRFEDFRKVLDKSKK